MSARVLPMEEGRYDSLSLPRVWRGTDREAKAKVSTVSPPTRDGIAYGLLVCSLLHGQWLCVVQQWHRMVEHTRGDHRCPPNKACGR